MKLEDRLRLVLLYGLCLQLITSSGRKHADLHHFDFTLQPTSSYVTLDGKKYSFKCAASPSTAEIRWLFNGEPVNETLFNGYLRISKNNLVIRFPKSDIHSHSHNHNHNHNHNHSHHRGLNVTALQGGIFQCVALYRNNAIVSQAAKILIATLDPFPSSETITTSIPEGNTAVIPCSPPSSLPTVVTEFAVDDAIIDKSKGRFHLMPSGNLQIFDAKPTDSGSYRCISHNPYINQKRNASHLVILQVKKSRQNSERFLSFLLKPKPHISAILGTNVTLECVANGYPSPNITWSKLGGLLNKHRHTYMGSNLVLLEARKGHQGTYLCEASTTSGQTIRAQTVVDIQEVPQITVAPQDAELKEGQTFNLECRAKGKPAPVITWFHNGNRIVPEDANKGIRLTSDPSIVILESVDYYRHTGIYQCFATNKLESTYSFSRISIIDAQQRIASKHNEYGQTADPGSESDVLPENGVTDESAPGNKKRKKKNKGIKMVPPSRPEISRLSEDAVMVRWDVPPNDGLSILFFKVQYKEVGKTDWMTVDADIAPYIHSYALTNLKTGSKYKFRIAAVYQNNDNKSGATSHKFTLLKDPPMKKPSSPPVIIYASAISHTAIEIKWDYFDVDGVTEGFFIYYQATHTVSDYLKITVEGLNTRSHVITHLAANTAYDIKMQCFNVAGTSPFSNIYTNKTLKDPNVIYEENSHNDETNDVLQTFVPVTSKNTLTLYCIIGFALGAMVLIAVIYIFLCVLKNKQPIQPIGNNVSAEKLDKERKPRAPSLDHDFGNHMSSHKLNNHYSAHRSNGLIRNGVSEKSLNGFKVSHETVADNMNPLHIRVNSLYGSSTGISSNGKLCNDLRTTNSISQINLQNTTERKKGRYVEEHYPTFLSGSRVSGKYNSSFTRLNGTLERKRKSRNDLTANGETKEREPMLPACNVATPIIVMQSSC